MTCTFARRYRQCSRDIRALPLRSCCDEKSSGALASRRRLGGRIFRQTTGSYSSQSRRAHKCNCQERRRGSNVVSCSLQDRSSRFQSTGRSAQQTTDSLHHRNPRRHTATRQRRTYPDCKRRKGSCQTSISQTPRDINLPASLRAHVCDWLPLVKQRIVALSWRQIVLAVIAADDPQKFSQTRHAGTRAASRHWRDSRPAVRLEVVHLTLVVDGKKASATHREQILPHAFRPSLERPLRNKRGSLLGQQMILHRFQQQFLAMRVLANQRLRLDVFHQELPVEERQPHIRDQLGDVLLPVALMLNPVEDSSKNFFLAADVQLRVRNEVLDLDGEEERQLVNGKDWN